MSSIPINNKLKFGPAYLMISASSVLTIFGVTTPSFISRLMKKRMTRG